MKRLKKTVLIMFTILTLIMPSTVLANNDDNSHQLTLPLYQSHGTSVNFKDVNSTDWFSEDVLFLASNGIIDGLSDGSFNPNGALNVDAYVKLLVSALGFDLPNGTSYWASNYIDKAIELHLFDADTFSDYVHPITRGEMALLSANAVKLFEDITPFRQFQYHISDYDDIPAKYQDAVMINVSKGIITGYTDYAFGYDDTATRSQAAAIITRLVRPESRKQVNRFDEMELSLTLKANTLKLQEQDALDSINSTMDYIIDRDIDFNKYTDGSDYINLILMKLFQIRQLIAEEDSINLSNRGDTSYTSIVGGTEATVTLHEDHVSVEFIYNNEYVHYKSFDNFDICSYEDLDTGMIYYISEVLELDGYVIESIDPTTSNGYGYKCFYDGEDYYYELYDIFNLEQGNFLVYNVYEIIDRMYLPGYYDRTLSTKYITNENTHELLAIYDDQLLNGIRYCTNFEGEGYVLYTTFNSTFIGESNEGYNRGAGREVYRDLTTIGYYYGWNVTGEFTKIFDDGLILEDVALEGWTICSKGNYTLSNQSTYAFSNELDRILNEIITPDMTHDETIKAIHDYLVLNVVYSQQFTGNELDTLSINTAYAAIMGQETVCQGYAEAFNLLLTKSGIESYLVVGDVNYDGIRDHAWNYVRFEDGYLYYVDVTWDDPESGYRVDYTYYKVPHGTMMHMRNNIEILGYEAEF